VGGRGRPKDDSTEGEKTQPFPCIIRCETVRFRLQKNRNGGQLWAVNVFSYTIHAQTDCWQSRFPLTLSIFFPLLLWRFLSSQLFCVHYTVLLISTLITSLALCINHIEVEMYSLSFVSEGVLLGDWITNQDWAVCQMISHSLILPMRPVPPTLVDMIVQIMFADEYKSWSLTLCSFLQYHLNSFILGADSLSAPCLKTFSVCVLP
jgi:hypothetical protein